MRILIFLILTSLLSPTFASANTFKEITPLELESMMAKGGCVKFVYLFTSWCPICDSSFPSYSSLQQLYGQANMVGFMAISLDQDPQKLQDFISRHQPNFPVYRLIYSDGKAALETFNRLGINYRGRVPHATFRDCEDNVFADGSFQYPYYNTVLEYWRDNYLK